jgi:hypothetical protein
MDTLLSYWNSLMGTTTTVLQHSTASLDMAGLIALAAALGWASGLRLYAVVFVTGLAGYMGWLPLPEGLSLLKHPAMLGGSGFMLFIEFFADKIPGLDSLWDMVHSVIRVPAGAALAAGVFGADSGTMAAVAGLLGGSLAATSFATKAATRAAVNTSPEPFSNVAVSLLEDGASMGAMWLATTYPVAFGITLAVVVVLSLVLLAYLFKYLRAIYRRISQWLGAAPQPSSSPHQITNSNSQ